MIFFSDWNLNPRLLQLWKITQCRGSLHLNHRIFARFQLNRIGDFNALHCHPVSDNYCSARIEGDRCRALTTINFHRRRYNGHNNKAFRSLTAKPEVIDCSGVGSGVGDVEASWRSLCPTLIGNCYFSDVAPLTNKYKHLYIIYMCV